MTRFLFSNFLIWFFATLPMVLGNPAQLSGPVDGADLPPTDLERVQVGRIAPDFRLPDRKGRIHNLSDYRGKKVVLVFYRGHW